MIEYHAWAVIRESTIENSANEMNMIKKIQEFILKQSWRSGIMSFEPVNGQFHLFVSDAPNHRGERSEKIFSLFKFIALTAPGSYGLLYLWDDEDLIHGSENKFKVFVLARGSLEEKDDMYLSPCNPIIED